MGFVCHRGGLVYHVIHKRTYDDRKMFIVEGQDHEFTFQDQLAVLPGWYTVYLSCDHEGVRFPDGSPVPVAATSRSVEVR
jgi:hypothetical protein